jgi:hypothetical protein
MVAVETAFSGGGYFRLFPFILISFIYNQLNSKDLPVNSYFHARDFDPSVPRVSMPIHRYFKCYINLKRSYPKLEKIIKRYPFCSVRDWRNKEQLLPVISIDSYASLQKN